MALPKFYGPPVRLPSSVSVSAEQFHDETRKCVGIPASTFLYIICSGNHFCFTWKCSYVTNKWLKQCRGLRHGFCWGNYFIVVAKFFWIILNGENNEKEFANLDTKAKRDWHLQMSAAALVCSSILQMKQIKKELEEVGKPSRSLNNSIFVGEALCFCCWSS